MYAEPLAKCRRMSADVYRHIINLTRNDPDELSLRLLDLVMQASQHTLTGFRMVVLYKIKRDSGVRKFLFLVTLYKKAPFIWKDFGFNDQDTWNGSGNEVQINILV